ncbi:MAG TPA: heparan-alpha-glucosaminide N-acetyltransferase domain-containing protein, partial [Puia sp.]|nr:heparan-alpha-glucosaminide N-acetyltransferase domain-containing protein [Puia sp.]
MKQRFYSLDVFRGATVALMILVNNPGSWSYIYAPLEHAPWQGCTPTDLVFPFFLFAVGNAMAFVLPRLEAAGDAAFLKKILTRTLLIFGIGLFLNWFPFIKWSGDHLIFKAWVDTPDPAHPTAEPTGIRILGVLQRIALAYCFASLIIYYGKIRGAFVTGAVILLGYWALCFLLGNPADPYSMTGYFGTNVDKAVLGAAHMYKGEGVAFDPEGLASTLPAIVQVIFGYLVGNYISQKGKTFEMLSGLFVIGCMLAFVGYWWDMVFPISKKIWTSSFVI